MLVNVAARVHTAFDFEVDIIDVCVPNRLCKPMAVQVLEESGGRFTNRPYRGSLWIRTRARDRDR